LIFQLAIVFNCCRANWDFSIHFRYIWLFKVVPGVDLVTPSLKFDEKHAPINLSPSLYAERVIALKNELKKIKFKFNRCWKLVWLWSWTITRGWSKFYMEF
jgi:hypothetical protein